MAIDINSFESFVKILVIGVGGGGSNAVNRMIEDHISNDSIDFTVFNTDAQDLATSKAPNRYVLGEEISKGLGAGGDPEIGRQAAMASSELIKEVTKNYDMVFIACGEGGGTGTGAAPIIAKIAKENGALTIAIVTKPFTVEGNLRLKRASEGIVLLKENVDSMIIISNDKLMFMSGAKSVKAAFAESDELLSQTVKTITDIILLPGVINLDFADVKNILKDKGLALIGFGKGSGPNKAKDAAATAISCPLLDLSIQGAKQAIINVTASEDVPLDEIQSAVTYVTGVAGGDVNIIFGIQINSEMQDSMIVSVIATDFDENVANNLSNVISTRDGKVLQTHYETQDGEISQLDTKNENVNPAQVDDKNSNFSQDDDILPNFFDEYEKAHTHVEDNSQDNQDKNN